MSISVSHISKRFGNFTALDNVSLDFPSGELVALLGPSGCGKTTLLRIVAGLERADAGEVFLEGTEASAMHVRERAVGYLRPHELQLFPDDGEAQGALPATVVRITSSGALASVELSRDDGEEGRKGGGRLEVTVFRDYLRQLGVREGDRVRLKPQRVRVFPAEANPSRLAA
jgi:ABC-type sulfate/molybdate transport systems ATPase subunit